MRDAPEQPDAAATVTATTKTWNADAVANSRARNTLQSVLAAGHGGPFEGDLEGDLGEGEREQREVQSAPAQDDRADREREQSREDGREHERRRARCRSRPQDAERGGIARAAEEHGGAERHEAGVADQQVHAGAVERVDRDLRDQRDRRAEQRPGRSARRERRAVTTDG